MSRLDLITEALRASFGSASKLASAGDICLASAKNYRAGKGVPNLVTLAKLMRQSPDLLAALIEYAGLDERSLDIAAARLRHAKAELQTEWAATHADLARILDEREARLGMAADPPAASADRPAQPENSRVLKP